MADSASGGLSAAELAALKRKSHRFYLWVLLGMAAGGLLGWASPSTGVAMEPLSKGFIALIKMVIGPIIFCTIVHGVVELGDLRQMGRVGLKALIYFEGLTTLALIIGLVVVNALRPGAGIDYKIEAPAGSAAAAAAAGAAEGNGNGGGGFADFLLHIIPKTVASPFTEGDVLQVLLVSLLFAAAMVAVGEPARPLLDLVERLGRVLFQIIRMIMRLAPFGAFGAMAFTVGKFGLSSLQSLGWLMAGFYATCALFVFGVLGPLLWLTCGLSIGRLLRYLGPELWVVLGTSSSEAALPDLMRKLEGLGCRRSLVGMVVPTGYSFNLDGTSIYLTMGAIFTAQATNTPLTIGDQIGLLLVMLITSKGAAGVSGSGFVTLAATLQARPVVPPAGLQIILGIDRLMSEARALTNFAGNAVATVIIARWEGALDLDRARAALSGAEPEDAGRAG